jgi:hypothetical protein
VRWCVRALRRFPRQRVARVKRAICDCRSVVRAASPTGEVPAVGNARLEASGVMERMLLDIERLSKIERL